MKQQDLLGIFFAIGITVIAVGVAFAGNSLEISTTSTQITSSISHPPTNTLEYGFGAITNTDGESIDIEFVGGDEINLDDSDGFIRAKITYTGYLQQMGIVYFSVFSVNTGEFVKEKSEVQLDLINDNIWVTDVMHIFDKQNFIDNPNLVGTYLLKFDTENGTLSAKAPFTVLMPSVKPIETTPAPSVVAVSANPQQQTTVEVVENNVEVTTMANSFSLSDLEPLFKDKVGKTYLTKILKEYYAETISKEEFLHLKSFDDLDCSVTFIDTPNDEEINISCNLKSE